MQTHVRLRYPESIIRLEMQFRDEEMQPLGVIDTALAGINVFYHNSRYVLRCVLLSTKAGDRLDIIDPGKTGPALAPLTALLSGNLQRPVPDSLLPDVLYNMCDSVRKCVPRAVRFVRQDTGENVLDGLPSPVGWDIAHKTYGLVIQCYFTSRPLEVSGCFPYRKRDN